MPDHIHPAVTLTALSLKKHVYGQKPLTRTIGEARAVQTTARRAGVVTQTGNLSTAAANTAPPRKW